MEGGQVNNINLNAGLDTASSDMLVPVNEPTFQHNWQKFQGKFLPNSLRYEQNGWAAGWNVYDFKYSTSKIKIEDGIYVSRIKLNSNPSYSLSVFDALDSVTPILTVKYNDSYKLLNVSEGEASIYDNKIGGSFNGADYVITWDETTGSAQFNGPANFELRQVINNDYTISFNIVDTANTYTYDFNLWSPGKLTSDSFSQTINWSKFTEGKQYWGEDFCYDTAENVMFVPDSEPIVPILSDGNKLTFDFTQTLTEQIELNLNLQEYLLKFKNIKLDNSKGVNEKNLINTNASELTNLSKQKFEFSNTELVPYTDGIVAEQIVPVYLTAAAKLGDDNKPDISTYIKKPENTHPSKVQMKLPHTGLTIKLGSVFNPGVENSFVATDAYKHRYMPYFSTSYDRFKWIVNNVGNRNDYTDEGVWGWSEGTWYWTELFGNRYNYIKISNSLTPSSNWQPYKYKPNTRYYPYATAAFSMFSDYDSRNRAMNVLGGLYTIRNNAVNMANFFRVNDIWNAEDINNVFFENNISTVRSIKLANTPAQADTIDDMDFVRDNMSDLLKYIVTKSYTSAPAIYNPAQADSTYNSIYQANGKYIGSTFEYVGETLTSDNTFWPFEYVPCFNFNGQKCYWTNGTQVITTLEEFKEFVLGNYDPEAVDTPIILQDDFNRIRNVNKYAVHYDFDKLGFTDAESILVPHEQTNWEALWKRWYPNYADPAEMLIEPDEDSTFIDYDNIVVVEDARVQLRYEHPGALAGCLARHPFGWPDPTDSCHDQAFVFCPNVFDVYPLIQEPDMTVDLSKVQFKVWQNHIEVTDKYELDSEHSWDETYTDPYGHEQPCTYRSGGTGIAPGWFKLAYDTANGGGFHHIGTYVKAYITANVYKVDLARYQESWEEAALQNLPKVGIANWHWDRFEYTDVDDNIFLLFDYSEPVAKLAFKEKVNETGWVHYHGGSYKIKVKVDTDVPPYYKYETVSSKTNVKVAFALENTYANTYANTYVNIGNWDIVYVIPFEGRIASEVKYNYISTAKAVKLGETDDLFTFNKAPDIRLDNKKLYVDRTINQYSYDWFDQALVRIEPLTGDITMPAYFEVSAACVNDAVLFVHKTNASVTTQTKELFEYYAPGVIFGDKASEQGNMTAETVVSTAHITMNETYVKLPEDISGSVKSQTVKVLHSLYGNIVSSFSDVDVQITGYDYQEGLAYALLKTSAFELPLVFNAEQNKLINDTSSFESFGVHVDINKIEGTDALEYLPLVFDLDYKNCNCRYLKTDNLNITAADELGEVTLDNNINYNYISQRSLGSDVCNVDTISSNQQFVHIEKDTKQKVTCVLPQVFGLGSKNGDIVTIDPDINVDIKLFDGLENDILVESTDIRDTEHVKVIGKLKQDAEFQLLKQQWNSTIEVENFWWVDSTHILELNNRFLTLKHNTGKLDDWNGNRWEKIWDAPRFDYITQFTRVHFVTNVSGNDKALLCCLRELDTYTIECKIFSILPVVSLRNTVYFKLNVRDIGTRLNDALPDINTAYLNTYNKLTANQLLVQAHWSNTLIDDRLIVGCHLSKNFDQWSIVFNLELNKFERVVQGYGFVGLKGDLTGGQLPRYCFDDRLGFNNTVEPINKLLDSDGNGEIDTTDCDARYRVDPKNINVVHEIIVGSAEQQWYIRKQVFGIVSHLTYQGDGQFKVEELPITNKYDSVYGSPSFKSIIVGDMMLQPHAFADLLKIPSGTAQKAWSLLSTILGYPSVWFFSPRLTRCVYLQQTLGQYAYVHYNTLETRPDPLLGNDIDEQERQINNDPKKSNFEKLVKDKTTNPLHDISMSFDKQVVEQRANIELATSNFAVGIHFLFLEMAKHSSDINYFVNSELNETLANGESQMLSQFSMEQIAYISEKALTTKGVDFACKNAVVGVKTLDMFYSTSDQQEIYAGPGFVEHQFVADCVAQSTVGVDAEGQVQQTTWLLANLTIFILEKEAILEKRAAEAMQSLAKTVAAEAMCGTSLAAVFSTALEYSAKAAILASEKTLEASESFKEMISPLADHITSGSTGDMFRHDLSVEANHKYGSKNEHFMWPCWGVPSEGLDFTDETVIAAIKRTQFQINLPAAKFYTKSPMRDLVSWVVDADKIGSYQDGQSDILETGAGKANYLQATCVGSSTMRKLPADMAKIEGVSCFLPTTSFKNKNVGMPGPTFAPSVIQDYVVDKDWNISICCSFGERPWVACKDTKLINCEASNMIINDSFCGIASPYTAIEVKRGLSKEYMRPWAITPNTLAMNCTGYNTILDDKLYHSFDGYSFRVVDLVGAPGMDKQLRARLYAFQENDRFKRSNIPPANTLLGNFKGEGVQFIQSIDPFWTEMNVAFAKRGLVTGTESEDRDGVRWAIPIFTEQVSTLPAVVKTLAAFPLAVVDGATGLCTTHLIDSQAKYKAPLSVDFSINKNTYRATEEYICSIEQTELISTVKDLIPSLGLKFIGATPFEAFFYSKATRCYYSFNGNQLAKVNMLERFRDIQKGYWDFVNQEVVMPCLITYKRLNKEVEDKDTETDNIIVPLLKDSQVKGELPPPLTTIFNDRSWYKCVSLPSGFAYQGPNRVIINRAVFVEYMLQSMRDNMNKWQKLPREKYSFKRKYQENYSEVNKDVNGVKGWTYNPFVLVTSALGTGEGTDCLFEWDITFCWPIEMDLLYGTDNYAVVNIMAETMTPGGKVLTRPTHVFLTKELFTRTGNYGYYNFRYQSKNGAGNRERLHIWSDQYIAISSLNVDVKPVTQRRTEQLTQQVDIQRLKEL